jgi:hypothetical protein
MNYTTVIKDHSLCLNSISLNYQQQRTCRLFEELLLTEKPLKRKAYI